MARNEKELDGVTLLGNQGTTYEFDYTPNVLESFVNKHPENEYLVTLDCPEFTSLCPKTGQPDFGHIVINYIPRIQMVESKSLKLYLFSFRNRGDFHEDCVNIIISVLVVVSQLFRLLTMAMQSIKIWCVLVCLPLLMKD